MRCLNATFPHLRVDVPLLAAFLGATGAGRVRYPMVPVVVIAVLSEVHCVPFEEVPMLERPQGDPFRVISYHRPP